MGAVPLFSGEGTTGSHVTQCRLGRDLLRIKWHLDRSSRLATTDVSKIGWVVHLFWGGTWVPSGTMWPWLRPTSVPSGIFIHPAVWPQPVGRKWGSCCPPFFGRIGSRLTQCTPHPITPKTCDVARSLGKTELLVTVSYHA